MTTIAPTPDTPSDAGSAAATSSSGQDARTPTEDSDGHCAVADGPRRRLLDRISEAVRAAHAASVPF